MKTKRMLLTTALVIAIAALVSVPAGAFPFVTGTDTSCSQCHTTFTIGGAQHTVHSSQFSCALCHVGAIGANPVEPTACVQCHDTTDVFVLHGPLVSPDGYQCGYCHEGVGAQEHTWTELKNIFE
ncbi:MAG: hypothetical protein R3D98_16990 [Candidatus Krumholzibacteriia bacterium]